MADIMTAAPVGGYNWVTITAHVSLCIQLA